MDERTVENIATSLTVLGLFILYHIVYFYRIYHKQNGEHPTMSSVNFANRRIWAACLMAQGDSLLAVQTLRNWSYSASMIAAADVSIVFGVLGLASNIYKLNISPSDPNQVELLGLYLNMQDWKLGIIFALYLASFFCFSQTLRYLNHVIFLIHTKYSIAEVKAWQTDKSVAVVNKVTPKLVARILNFGASFYWLGLRFFYLGLPALMWLFNHWAMFATGLLLIVALFFFDDAGSRHYHPHEDVNPNEIYTEQKQEQDVQPVNGSNVNLRPQDAAEPRRRVVVVA